MVKVSLTIELGDDLKARADLGKKDDRLIIADALEDIAATMKGRGHIGVQSSGVLTGPIEDPNSKQVGTFWML
jgi:hypothetical protein